MNITITLACYLVISIILINQIYHYTKIMNKFILFGIVKMHAHINFTITIIKLFSDINYSIIIKLFSAINYSISIKMLILLKNKTIF